MAGASIRPDEAQLGDVLPADTFPAQARSPMQVPVIHTPTLVVVDLASPADDRLNATFEIFTFERVPEGWQRTI